MVDYGFNVDLNTPDLIDIAQNAKKRDDERAAQDFKDYISLMQMLGRGYGAYQMYNARNNYKPHNPLWDDVSVSDDYGEFDYSDLDW
jgi:hypothetical protein